MVRRTLTLCLLSAFAVASPATAADDLVTRTVVSGESSGAAQRALIARKAVAEGRFEDALTEYLGLQEEAGDKLVLLDALEKDRPAGGGPRPLVSVRVRWLCQRDLAAMPAAGLKLYRDRIDGQARKWLDQAIAQRDANLLRRVVEEAFASRAAEQALDLLGDLAFERGRFDEADRWWRLLAVPASEEKPEPPFWSYPDPKGDVARVRARQILARACAGEPVERLRSELTAFRDKHPKAEGSLAGRRGVYADILQALLDKPAELTGPAGPSGWTTFAANASRTSSVAIDDAAKRLADLSRHGPHHRFSLETTKIIDDEREDTSTPGVMESVPNLARRLNAHPVIVGRTVLVADARRVVAYDALAGRAEVWFDVTELDAKTAGLAKSSSDLRPTLTVADGCVYARFGRTAIGAEQDGPSVVVCLAVEPRADGKRLLWTLKPPAVGDASVFEGTPLVQDGRLHVAVTSYQNGRPAASVCCYSTRGPAPKLLWQQELSQGQSVKVKEERVRHHLLTRAGSLVVYCSHDGVVAAVDAVTGHRAWAVRYPPTAEAKPPWPRDLCPPVCASGRIFVAPADSEGVLAFDALTGQPLWQRDRVEVVHLLGAPTSCGRLIVVTPRGVRALDAGTGSDTGGWAQPADGSEVWPFGRGLLLGDLLLWPLHDQHRGRVLALGLDEGEPPDVLPPDRLRQVRPGNMAYADGVLAVASLKTLDVYVEPRLLLPARQEDVRRTPTSGSARYQLALADGSAESFREAERVAKPGEGWRWGRLQDLARDGRHELLMATAGSRDEQIKALVEAGTEVFRPEQRLRAHVRQARLWAEAGDEARADEVWRAVLKTPALRDAVIVNAGLPQSGGVLARRDLDPVRAPPPSPQSAPPPDLPLLRSWQVRLADDEEMLVPEDGETDQQVFCARPGELVCRDAETGKRLWAGSLPFRPTWLGPRGSTVIVGADDGVCVVAADDGRLVWRWTMTNAELSGVRLAGGRLFALLHGGRRLIAFDLGTGRVLWGCWAPAGRLDLPSPAGRFHPLFHADARHVVAQTSGGRLWVLDAADGRTLHDVETVRSPWPAAPLPFGDDQLLISEAGAVVLYDADAGKEVWRYALEMPTTLTGQGPRIIRRGDTLLVITPRNFGPTLMRLDPATGRPLWEQERSLGSMPICADGIAASESTLFVTQADTLSAYATADGRPLWSVKAPESRPGERWRLLLSRGAVLAYPEATRAWKTELRTPLGTWSGTVMPRSGEEHLAVYAFDPSSGRLLQRVRCEPDPTSERMKHATRWAVLPSLEVRQMPVRCQWVRGGLVIGREGQLWGRR